MIANINGDAVSVIASSLSTLAVIAKTLYDKQKGKPRDRSLERIERRLDRIEDHLNISPDDMLPTQSRSKRAR